MGNIKRNGFQCKNLQNCKQIIYFFVNGRVHKIAYGFGGPSEKKNVGPHYDINFLLQNTNLVSVLDNIFALRAFSFYSVWHIDNFLIPWTILFTINVCNFSLI